MPDKPKHIGTLTFHDEYNFGAVLQAFSLQRTIQSLGHANAIINFARPTRGTARRMFHFTLDRASVIHNLLSLSTLRSQMALRKRFAAFVNAQMTLTPESYHSAQALDESRLPFDVFVTGSDIVWQPAWLATSYASVYYLDFAKTGRRVAYAPSFGVSEIPPQHRGRIAEYLNRFDFLSAREESGCRIIRELTGREAMHVLDPTLLQPASEYDKVATAPSQSEPYILMYPMQESAELHRLASNVKRRLGLPLIAVVPVYRNRWKYEFADKVVYDAGPADFLGWLKHAAFVCTNSFHGTAFSIIYRKRFLASPSQIMNTRTIGLLERVGLESRQVHDADAVREHGDVLDPIDYASVELRLNQAVEESRNYLANALR